MAQTNFTPILLYSSSTPTNAPSAGNLTNSANGSEIAINIADKNLFFKDSGGVVNTVPIRQSSASSNGWLSSTDWSTFNSKAPATSGTSILYGNGTGGFSNVTIGSGISFAGGTLSATGSGGTVTSVAALTLGTTGTDLSSTVANGTTTPVITLNVPTASAANRGALSSTDWSTFNGKQAALVSGTNIKTVGGVTLLGSGDVGTIGTGYGGTGLTSFTSGGVVYASSTSALTTGAALYFSGADLGVGTNAPYQAKLDVTGTGGVGNLANIAASNSNSDQLLIGSKDRGTANPFFGMGTGTAFLVGLGNGVAPALGIGTYGAAPIIFGTSNTEKMRIDPLGSLCLGINSNGYGVAGAIYAPEIYNYTTAAAANLYIESGGFFRRSTSSIKYKTDVQDATHGLADVMKLRSVTYKGINDGETVFGGLIAEEVDAAGLTEFVQYADDGSPDALAYGQMVSLCIKAIQELNTKFDAYVASHP